MVAITHRTAAHVQPLTVVLRTLVVLLTLGTAAIHASLGGMLFMANAAGYVSSSPLRWSRPGQGSAGAG